MNAGPFSRRTFDGQRVVWADSIQDVIYCVVPEPLAGDLLDRLTDYYADDPNVTVIVDRRRASRRQENGSSGGGKRELRDRRRHRVTGELPALATD